MNIPSDRTLLRKEFGTALRDVIRNVPELSNIALECAKAAMRADYLDINQKKQTIGLVKDWTNYVDNNRVTSEDPFMIREHIANFAKQTFEVTCETMDPATLPVRDIRQNGVSYEDVISRYVNPEIIDDPEVAIFGGTARLALKMLAGVDIAKELPVHDIDAIISTDTDMAEKAASYGVDLTGARLIEGDIPGSIRDIISNTDCTMNQAIIYNGSLYYTEAALKDVSQGIIRPTLKDDPLFGTEGFVDQNGNPYFDRKSLYRTLSFLLRGKGDRIAISEENLEQEKVHIGRYWVVILYVKLLSIGDEARRHEAIGHWYDIARRLDVTTTDGPEDFLIELLDLYPEMRSGQKYSDEYNTEVQLRRIGEKLGDRAVDLVCGKREIELPSTYTPAYIERSPSFEEYDDEKFMETIRANVHSSRLKTK